MNWIDPDERLHRVEAVAVPIPHLDPDGGISGGGYPSTMILRDPGAGVLNSRVPVAFDSHRVEERGRRDDTGVRGYAAGASWNAGVANWGVHSSDAPPSRPL